MSGKRVDQDLIGSGLPPMQVQSSQARC